MDAGIHFVFLHSDQVGPWSPSVPQKNQAKLTIVCEFQGLQQTMAELHVD